MGFSGLRRHSRSVSGSRAPRRWALGLLMVLVAVVAGGSVFAIEHLRISADSAQSREVSDLQLSRSVEQLSSLEWQAVAQIQAVAGKRSYRLHFDRQAWQVGSRRG